MNSSKRLQQVLICSLIAIVGLGTSAWYGPKLLREATATKQWPETTGIVESSHVSSQRRNSGTDWHVAVRYSYVVDEQRHESARYSITGPLSTDTEGQAQMLARGFRVGDEMPVYYDPADPTQAVLVRGGEQKAWLTILFGVLLVLVGGLIVMKRLVGDEDRTVRSDR